MILSIYQLSINAKVVLLTTFIHKERRMLGFLFKKEISKTESINEFYAKLKELYPEDSISDNRKEELSLMISQYGYLQ